GERRGQQFDDRRFEQREHSEPEFEFRRYGGGQGQPRSSRGQWNQEGRDQSERFAERSRYPNIDEDDARSWGGQREAWWRSEEPDPYRQRGIGGQGHWGRGDTAEWGDYAGGTAGQRYGNRASGRGDFESERWGGGMEHGGQGQGRFGDLES